MSTNKTETIKSHHEFYTCFSSEDSDSDDKEDNDPHNELPDLSKTTLITSLDSEDDEEEKLNTVSGYSQLLDELSDIYKLFQNSDMREVRNMFSAKVTKPTIEKLHSDFERDFKDIPNDDPIRVKCIELLGYFGIPLSQATHPDLS